MEKKISKAVVRRLPKYHRYLTNLKESGVKKISSKELSDMIGFTASQIRQDFNNFGGFGQQGYGYNVEELLEEVKGILGLGQEYSVVILGAGNLGSALAKFNDFERYQFNIKALFDIDEAIVNKKINGITVHHTSELDEFLIRNEIDIAFICTGNSVAQELAEKAVSLGVRGIWNFAMVDLHLPSSVIMENVHLIDNLFTMSYFLKSK